MKPVIRYLRFHCQSPDASPVLRRDGILAIAAIREKAHLLLVDMDAWGRNSGASVKNAAAPLLDVAHGRLIAGFGIGMADTCVAVLDRSGNFDVIAGTNGGRATPLPCTELESAVAVQSREEFFMWAGEVSRPMLHAINVVRHGQQWTAMEG